MSSDSPESSPLQQSLEAALVADPDDLGAHSAYADYLNEQGNPLGEFIQVQLALEDTERPPSERLRLQERERELLDQHQRQWLVELGRYLLDQEGITPRHLVDLRGYQFGWSRGWIDTIEVPVLTHAFAVILAAHPAIRLLRRLTLRSEDPNPPLLPGRWPLTPLIESPFLGNVEVFQIGEEISNPWADPPAHLTPLLCRMPRLEKLRLYAGLGTDHVEEIVGLDTLSNLRVLEVVGSAEFDTEVIAGNSALSHLSRLRIEVVPEYRTGLATEGVRAVLRSKNMKRLRELRLGGCTNGNSVCRLIERRGLPPRLKVLGLLRSGITDRGANLLARCEDVEQLELLDVSGNYLTEQGVQMLQGAVQGDVEALGQRDMADGDDDRYDTITE